MKRFIDPDLILRAYRDPLAIANLAVDTLPVVAVLAFGWTATPLVALYWLENLVLGAFTVLRMLASATNGAVHIAMAAFMVPFFCVHYGMFCFVHGIFVRAFSQPDMNGGSPADSYPDLIGWALGAGPNMIWFLAAIIAISAAFYLRDFIFGGEYKRASLPTEMFSPYGRIVTLHVAILLGAFIAIGLKEPLVAVLFLIVLRVVFGIAFTVLRRLKREKAAVAPETQAPTAVQS